MNTQVNDPKGEAGNKKAPMHLLPPYALEQCSWVHKLGASKYGAYNWRDTGVCATTYVSAIMRHLNAWRDGEDLDPESGISHIAHIAASCNILLDAQHCDKLQDDRNKKPVLVTFAAVAKAEAIRERDEWRQLANDVLETLRVTREKYGIGNRHVMREKNRDITEAWNLLNVLSMNMMDSGPTWPRVLEWLKRNEHYRPTNNREETQK